MKVEMQPIRTAYDIWIEENDAIENFWENVQSAEIKKELKPLKDTASALNFKVKNGM